MKRQLAEIKKAIANADAMAEDDDIPDGYEWIRNEWPEGQGQGHSGAGVIWGEASCGAGVICVRDGRYLITFGGRAHPEDPTIDEEIDLMNNLDPLYGICTDVIMMYDLENMDSFPVMSSIRCPVKGECHALSMRDRSREDLVTFGFVNRLFRSELKGTQFLPRHIIQLIADWVEMENVYLLQQNGKGHWKISLDVILESLIGPK